MSRKIHDRILSLPVAAQNLEVDVHRLCEIMSKVRVRYQYTPEGKRVIKASDLNRLRQLQNGRYGF